MELSGEDEDVTTGTPVGLSLSSRSDLTAEDFVRYAVRAEEAGINAVFATETASDAIALAQGMATATDTVQVGTAITNVRWRHPALAAAAAGTAAQLSGDRFVLGLGVANPGFNERQLGMPPAPPLQLMREYVLAVRAALVGGLVQLEGDLHRLQGYTPASSATGSVPIWVGALQPGMLRLAGAVGDGALLNLSNAEMVARAVAHVRAGAEEAKRDPQEVLIACVVPCALSENDDVARSAARHLVASYALHPAASRLFADSGGGTDIAAVAAALRAGDADAAAGLVDEGFARSLVVTDGRLDTALSCYREAGVDLPILFPVQVAGDWRGSIEAALQAVYTEGTST